MSREQGAAGAAQPASPERGPQAWGGPHGGLEPPGPPPRRRTESESALLGRAPSAAGLRRAAHARQAGQLPGAAAGRSLFRGLSAPEQDRGGLPSGHLGGRGATAAPGEGSGVGLGSGTRGWRDEDGETQPSSVPDIGSDVGSAAIAPADRAPEDPTALPLGAHESEEARACARKAMGGPRPASLGGHVDPEAHPGAHPRPASAAGAQPVRKHQLLCFTLLSLCLHDALCHPA